MTTHGEMPEKSGRGSKAQREDNQNDDEGTFTADVSGSSDEDTTVREVQVRVDDLSEIAHKPDD